MALAMTLIIATVIVEVAAKVAEAAASTFSSASSVVADRLNAAPTLRTVNGCRRTGR